MMTRWLAGFAIFALGFGCAQVMKVAPAGAEDGMLDEGLQVIEHADKFELINTGLYRYLLVVQPKTGAPVTMPDISAVTGTVSVDKKGVEGVTVIRLQPLGKITPGDLHDWGCNPGIEDCVGPEPILPPRPPKYEIELGPSSFTDPDAFPRP
jgi:hypothetical protein